MIQPPVYDPNDKLTVFSSEVSASDALISLNSIRQRIEQAPGVALTKLLNSHPVMVISVCFFLFVSVGYAAEKVKMSPMGIDVAAFAEIDDLLLAAFKNTPFVLVTLAFLLLYTTAHFVIEHLAVRRRQDMRNALINAQVAVEKIRSYGDLAMIEKDFATQLKDFDKYCRRVNFFLSGLLALVLVSPYVAVNTWSKYLLSSSDNSFLHSQQEVQVFLRTGHVLPSSDNKQLKFLTATERFVFLRQFCTGNTTCEPQTISIPSASIAGMAHYPGGTIFADFENFSTKVPTSMPDPE